MSKELFNFTQKSTKKPVEKAPDRVITPRVKTVDSEETVSVDKVDTVYERISDACGGNPYLESMILGELINSPRHKRR